MEGHLNLSLRKLRVTGFSAHYHPPTLHLPVVWPMADEHARHTYIQRLHWRLNVTFLCYLHLFIFIHLALIGISLFLNVCSFVLFFQLSVSQSLILSFSFSLHLLSPRHQSHFVCLCCYPCSIIILLHPPLSIFSAHLPLFLSIHNHISLSMRAFFSGGRAD